LELLVGLDVDVVHQIGAFPLGQLIVSDETPAHVRKEAKKDLTEDLGDFVKRVAQDRYLYYVAPPEESWAFRNGAVQLQRRQTTALRSALNSAQPDRS
jgi:hypothetical protein